MHQVDLTTAVEERNVSQLDIKLQERRLNMYYNLCGIARTSLGIEIKIVAMLCC